MDFPQANTPLSARCKAAYIDSGVVQSANRSPRGQWTKSNHSYKEK